MRKTDLSHAFTAGLVLLFMLSISGCGLLGDGKNTEPEFDMHLDRLVIASGEPLNISLSVKNPSYKTMIFITSCKEFAGLYTYQNNELVHFSGNNSGCARMINTYELEPGGTLSFNWDLTASLVTWNSETSLTDTTNVAPGEYTMQIRLNANSVNGQEFKTDRFEKTILID